MTRNQEVKSTQENTNALEAHMYKWTAISKRPVAQRQLRLKDIGTQGQTGCSNDAAEIKWELSSVKRDHPSQHHTRSSLREKSAYHKVDLFSKVG